MSTNKPYTWSQTVRRVSGRIERHTDSTIGYWYDGMVATPYGYVTVYSQRDHTSLRAIVNGREYQWSESRGHGGRGLAIMAGKFIWNLHQWIRDQERGNV